MSEEKPKTKNQIVSDKVKFITTKGWNQFRPGNAETGIVWKKDEQITNLETAYLSEKRKEDNAKSGKGANTGGASQGPKTIPPLTAAQKKEIDEKTDKKKK